MTEIAVRDEPANGVVVRRDLTPLEQFATQAQLAAELSVSLAKTDFVPQSLRGKPENLAAAILAGMELGLKPMAALRSMDVIYGVPALRAHAMRGLIQSHGHHIQVVESDDQHCIMRGRRADETDWQMVEWTMERANKMGLPQRKSKDPTKAGTPNQWQLQPKTMLIARATGEIARLIAADVLFAMPYAAEELDHDDAPIASAPAPRVTAAEILGTAPDDPDGDGINPPQLRMLHALFGRVDMAERDDRLRYASEVIGRDLESSNDLSKKEAGQVIDKLQAWATQLEPEQP